MADARIVTPAAGDTWDWVAMAIYGDEKYTPILLQANPAYVDRVAFDGTEILTLPDLDTEDADEAQTAPWR